MAKNNAKKPRWERAQERRDAKSCARTPRCNKECENAKWQKKMPKKRTKITKNDAIKGKMAKKDAKKAKPAKKDAKKGKNCKKRCNKRQNGKKRMPNKGKIAKSNAKTQRCEKPCNDAKVTKSARMQNGKKRCQKRAKWQKRCKKRQNCKK